MIDTKFENTFPIFEDILGEIRSEDHLILSTKQPLGFDAGVREAPKVVRQSSILVSVW